MLWLVPQNVTLLGNSLLDVIRLQWNHWVDLNPAWLLPLSKEEIWAARVAQWFNTVFSLGHDPGDPGWSPTSGSLHGACFSLCLYLCLSLSPLFVSHEEINKILKKNHLYKKKKRKFGYKDVHRCKMMWRDTGEKTAICPTRKRGPEQIFPYSP